MKRPFAALPEALRDSLASLSQTNGVQKEHAVVQTEGLFGKGCALVLGVLALAGVLVVAWQDHTWRSQQLYVAFGASFAGGALALWGFFRGLALRRSRVKPCVVATPLLIAKVGLEDGEVDMEYHKDLSASPNITNHFYNGGYTHTSFRLRFKDRPGELAFDVRNRALADGLFSFLRSTTQILQGWVADGTVDKRLREWDWIGAAGNDDDGALARAGRGSGLRSVALVLVASAAWGGLAWGANLVGNEERLWRSATLRDAPESYLEYLNAAPLGWRRAEAEVLRDDRLYERAVKSSKASLFRTYLATLPAGRHVADAREKLRVLYRDAETSYFASEKASKALPLAAQGMRALLAQLRESDTPVVGICFLPGEGLDGKEIEESLRQMTGSSRIQSVSSSFTVERNREREGRILAVMQASFRRVLPEDIFDLKACAAEAAGPRFLVRYRVVGKPGSYYTRKQEESLPLEKREVFAGIELHFDFTLQVPGSEFPPDPDPKKGYRFFRRAVPAPNFTVQATRSAPASTSAVYDKMADTAFEEFEVELANAYGLELAPPPAWDRKMDPEATPSARPAAPARVSGRVLDAAGKPVARAKVTVRTLVPRKDVGSATTGADGSFALTTEPLPGKVPCGVVVEADGFDVRLTPLLVTGGGAVVVPETRLAAKKP